MIPKILIKIYWLALKSWGKESHKIQEKEWKKITQTHWDGCHFSFPYIFSLSLSLTRDAFAENFFPSCSYYFPPCAHLCVIFCASRRTYKKITNMQRSNFIDFLSCLTRFLALAFLLGRDDKRRERDDDNEIQWKSSSRNFH